MKIKKDALSRKCEERVGTYFKVVFQYLDTSGTRVTYWANLVSKEEGRRKDDEVFPCLSPVLPVPSKLDSPKQAARRETAELYSCLNATEMYGAESNRN
jgi:hypothetical protein